MNLRIAGIVAAVVVFCASVQDQAADLDALQGRWSVAKTNQEGQAYSQVIEIEKDQLTFRIVDTGSQPRFVSKGTIKAVNVPPLDLLVVSDIRSGRSEDDLRPVDDSRTLVYTVQEGNLSLASNFDRARENEKPGMETYVRKELSSAASAEAKLVGKWKMDVALADNSYDYELRIARPGKGLEGVIVSPRSGEHRCKTVRLENGELVMEVDRQIQGNAVTFVFRGKLAGDALSGKVEVKEQEALSGTWKAKKG